VETPKGSKNKYEVSKEYDCILLDRVLHSSVVFPHAYGLIPRTYYYDEDPMDAMVMLSEPTFPGCVVEAKPIGILRIVDEKGKDDKILSVATKDPRLCDYNDIDDVPAHYLDEILEFFKTYKKLEEGKHTEVKGWEGKEEAVKEIAYGLSLFREMFAYK